MISTVDELIRESFEQMIPPTVDVSERTFDGTRAYVIQPPAANPTDSRVFLEIHGGALTQGAGECGKAMATHTAIRVGMPTWSVDYRMPPDHPYPAGLDDCLRVYEGLLRERTPGQIVIGGTSAGGNLAAALVLRARDAGLPLPSGLVLVSPEVDLTESGDTFQTLLGVDPVLTASLMPINLLYAGQTNLSDPLLSPLFGDFVPGFPPTLLASGTRDLFLSNAVRMHRALRRAGIPADLHVFEAAPHGGFMAGTAEDEDLESEIRQFVQTHCPAKETTSQ
jgi:acetyl esterase/lipase